MPSAPAAPMARPIGPREETSPPSVPWIPSAKEAAEPSKLEKVSAAFALASCLISPRALERSFFCCPALSSKSSATSFVAVFETLAVLRRASSPSFTESLKFLVAFCAALKSVSRDLPAVSPALSMSLSASPRSSSPSALFFTPRRKSFSSEPMLILMPLAIIWLLSRKLREACGRWFVRRGRRYGG